MAKKEQFRRNNPPEGQYAADRVPPQALELEQLRTALSDAGKQGELKKM